MNGDEIDDVAWLPPTPGGSGFVGGEIDGMKDKTEFFIWNCREESVIAVGNPFQLGGFIRSIQERGIDQWFASMPSESKSVGLKQCTVQFGSLPDAVLAVMKDVDIA